jgi:integrase
VPPAGIGGTVGRKSDYVPILSEFIRDQYLPHAFTTKRSACWEQIIFRNHLIPAFGEMKVNEISRQAVMAMVTAKVAAGYKPGTVNRILANLKVVLSKAVDWEVGGLTENVAKRVKPLRDKTHMDRFLSAAEAERLMVAIKKSQSPMLKYIIPFLLFTGARKREALDARWEFVSLERASWTIPLSKSGKPRFVPLSEPAVTILLKAKASANLMMNEPCPWVFPNPLTGKPYTSIYEPWNLCRRAAGLPDVRIHDLRHSFASALVNRGMTLLDVKEALGHANIVTTQRYAHLSQERLRAVVREAAAHYGSAT